MTIGPSLGIVYPILAYSQPVLSLSTLLATLGMAHNSFSTHSATEIAYF